MNLIAVLCTLVAPAQLPAARFEIHSASDKLSVGAIQRMESDGTVILQDGAKAADKDLVSIRRLSAPLPPGPSSAHLVMFNGDRLAGVVVAVEDSRLHFRAEQVQRTADEKSDGTLRVPLTTIAYLWMRSPEALDRERYASVFAEARANDQVVLRNGDVVSGTVTGLDARKGEIQVEHGKERSTIAVDKVIGIAFGTKLARTRKPAGEYAHAVLRNGTRLSLTAATIRDGTLSATTLFRDPIQVSLFDLASLDIYQGRAVYLSDIKPAGYQYRTYQGEKFEWFADRSLDGRDLQLKSPLGVHSFDKGVAVHGECTLTYALDGQYERFESVVGLDARLGSRGSVELQVLVDGKEQKIGDGRALTLENGPWRIKVGVTKAKELKLKVLWGEGGNVGDYVNWCDARLIRVVP